MAPVAATPPDVAMPDYTGTLLATTRLNALSASDRSAWNAYVLRSRERMQADLSLVERERARTGAAAVIRPPNTAADFTVQSSWTTAWVTSAAGRALTEAVRSYQTASGGWGKHIDYAKGVRTPGTGYNSESDEWAYVGTIDNGATVNELRLLAVAAPSDTAARSAFGRGLAYLFDAQFPTACWPQVYPLMGSYHDAATNNDDAAVNVLELLRDVRSGGYPFVSSAQRERTAAAEALAVRCLVASQVVVAGVRTTWAQQHDPLTQVPVIGRSYELPSLSGHEGARLMDVLMGLDEPSDSVRAAVHTAAAFYRATAIPNVVYVSGVGLVAAAGAGPVWARMMEIGTNRPIFANRDGVRLFDFAQLTDRRTGYAWFDGAPASSLRRYDIWSRLHPLPSR